LTQIETTAIYASAIGEEERNLAQRAWSSLELAIQAERHRSKNTVNQEGSRTSVMLNRLLVPLPAIVAVIHINLQCRILDLESF